MSLVDHNFGKSYHQNDKTSDVPKIIDNTQKEMSLTTLFHIII